MPVRYPPPDRALPTGRGGRGLSRQTRIVTYEESGPSFPRRVARLMLSAPILIPLVLVTVIVLVVLVYYWTAFSSRIDNLLMGEVFTRSAGIYAAPKQIRVGETLSQEDLIAYLKRWLR